MTDTRAAELLEKIRAVQSELAAHRAEPLISAFKKLGLEVSLTQITCMLTGGRGSLSDLDSVSDTKFGAIRIDTTIPREPKEPIPERIGSLARKTDNHCIVVYPQGEFDSTIPRTDAASFWSNKNRGHVSHQGCVEAFAKAVAKRAIDARITQSKTATAG